MPDVLLVESPITLEELKKLAQQRFGDMVKAVVDVRREVMAVGAELHADEEAVLLEKGSQQTDLWGINIYVDDPKRPYSVEFDSMINIRPSQNNPSRDVGNPVIRKIITEVVNKLIKA